MIETILDGLSTLAALVIAASLWRFADYLEREQKRKAEQEQSRG